MPARAGNGAESCSTIKVHTIYLVSRHRANCDLQRRRVGNQSLTFPQQHRATLTGRNLEPRIPNACYDSDSHDCPSPPPAFRKFRVEAVALRSSKNLTLHKAGKGLGFPMASASALTELAKSKCFGGEVVRYSHASQVTGCVMKFHVFFPPKAVGGEKCPVRLGPYPVSYLRRCIHLDSILSVGLDVHRRELYAQGRSPSLCRTGESCHHCSRHVSSYVFYSIRCGLLLNSLDVTFEAGWATPGRPIAGTLVLRLLISALVSFSSNVLHRALAQELELASTLMPQSCPGPRATPCTRT